MQCFVLMCVLEHVGYGLDMFELMCNVAYATGIKPLVMAQARRHVASVFQ